MAMFISTMLTIFAAVICATLLYFFVAWTYEIYDYFVNENNAGFIKFKDLMKWIKAIDKDHYVTINNKKYYIYFDLDIAPVVLRVRGSCIFSESYYLSMGPISYLQLCCYKARIKYSKENREVKTSVKNKNKTFVKQVFKRIEERDN